MIDEEKFLESDILKVLIKIYQKRTENLCILWVSIQFYLMQINFLLLCILCLCCMYYIPSKLVLMKCNTFQLAVKNYSNVYLKTLYVSILMKNIYFLVT